MSIVERNVREDRGAPLERRQLTILFCDLVDSTGLATRLDPEDLYELMLAFQQYCVQQVEAAGGYVARFAGDGVLAYFGYPVAVEDAPQCALQAALALREAGRHLRRPDGAPIAVRVGVATGLVVVGDLTSGGAHERAVAGETPNMAARLQSLAKPDTVLVSGATKAMTGGLFAFRSLGPVVHKGFAEASEVWELIGERPTVRRYDSRRAMGLSPLISRERELRAVLEAWEAAKAGQGGVVGILGDPGIGKSRLLEEARQRIVGEGPVLWLEGGGASIYDNSPFHVASQIVRSLAADGGEPPEADPFAGFAAAEAGGREALMARMTRRITAAAGDRPTVLIVEDLHWVDPSTLELLDLIVTAPGSARLLVIYTSRTEGAHRWPADVGRQTLELSRLDGPASADLARAAAGEQLSLAQVNAIVAQTAGVPLYIEELARLIAEQPASALDSVLPPTLADLLTARLEAAGPAKRHAQVAAVLGQEFSAALFAAMTDQDPAEGEAALDALEARALIVRRGGDDCAFRHALVAVAAYDTLLKRERRDLHARAARIIVERHPALARGQPQVVARHWTQAGELGEALDAWQACGASANQRRAFHEAEHAYRQALSVLDGAAPQDRDRVELTIRAAFNRVVQITQGYSAAEAESSSQRVTELAGRVGDPGALAREEQVRWRSVFTAGDYAEAETIADRVMALTQAHGEALWRRTFKLRAGIQHGFYTGDLARGERDFLDWTAIQDGSHRAAGDDALTMGIGGLIAQVCGRHGEGLGRIGGAFEVAARRANPYDLAMAIHTEVCFHHFAEDAARQAASAARLADVAAESGFEYASHLATGWLALADLNAGRPAEARTRAASAIRGFERLGARVSLAFWMGVLARTQWSDGDPDEALRTFEAAFACNPQELAFIPETYLARARLLEAAGREREAARDFAHVASLSQAMGADLFRFRALTALAAREAAAGGDGGALRAAADLSGLDHAPADRIRFDALAGAAS